MKNYGSGMKIGMGEDGGNKRSRVRFFANKPEMKLPIKKPTSNLIELDLITSN